MSLQIVSFKSARYFDFRAINLFPFSPYRRSLLSASRGRPHRRVGPLAVRLRDHLLSVIVLVGLPLSLSTRELTRPIR